MNAVVLLVIVAVVFVFGYRYYAKLLAVALFRPVENYSRLPAPPAPGGAAEGLLRFGQHLAAGGVLATWAGTALAAGWGWTPAFLWIVAASVTIGGVFGYGAIWLLRLPGGSGNALSRPGRTLFWGLTLVLLLATNGVFAWLIVALLVAVPQAVIPFWLHIPIAVIVGRFMVGRQARTAVVAISIAVALLALCTWLGTWVPITLSGGLDVHFGGTSTFPIDGGVVWLILLFIYLFYGGRLGSSQFAAPRAQLGGFALAFLLGLTALAILLGHPDMTAPNFHPVSGVPSIWPILFAVLPGGALAGLYMLVSAADAVPRVQTHEVRAFGYVTALLDGALALLGLLACTVTFGSKEAWQQAFSAGVASHGPAQALVLLVHGFARLLVPLGFEPAWSQGFVAAIAGIAGVVSIEAALRLQTAAVAELDAGTKPRSARARLPLLVLSLLFALGLHLKGGLGPVTGWPVLGAASLLATGLGLFLVGLALRRQGRSPLFVWLPALFIAVIGNWAMIDRMIVWVQRGQTWGATAAGGVVAIEIAIAAVALRALSRRPATA